MIFKNVTSERPIVAWWSGGADSAVACWLCLLWYGRERVIVVFIDTGNEDEDTYRFLADCEKWWGVTIKRIRSKKWDCIHEVWEHYLSLNTAKGAICSTELKRLVRIDFQNKNTYAYQAFGFDADEKQRAKNLKKNSPDSKPIFPLIAGGYKKGAAIEILNKNGIRVPRSYTMGYRNNNCLQTGCVRGGIGYWKKYKEDFPDRFAKMVEMERNLSHIKGEPVTICKEQSLGKRALVFLEHNPEFPDVWDISMVQGRKVKPLMECNGFCGGSIDKDA